MNIDPLYFVIAYITGVTIFLAFWFGADILNDLYDGVIK